MIGVAIVFDNAVVDWMCEILKRCVIYGYVVLMVCVVILVVVAYCDMFYLFCWDFD